MFLSLFEITSHCESCPWHSHRYFLSGIQIDLPHELGGRIAGPVTLGEEFFPHAFGIGLDLYLLVTSEEASLEMPGSEDQEESVDTRDDQSSYVDRVHVIIVKDNREDVAS